MLVVVRLFGSLVLSVAHGNRDAIADAFVLLALPGVLLSLLDLVGRDGEQPRLGWRSRLSGTVVLAVGLLLALGVFGWHDVFEPARRFSSGTRLTTAREGDDAPGVPGVER